MKVKEENNITENIEIKQENNVEKNIEKINNNEVENEEIKNINIEKTNTDIQELNTDKIETNKNQEVSRTFKPLDEQQYKNKSKSDVLTIFAIFYFCIIITYNIWYIFIYKFDKYKNSKRCIYKRNRRFWFNKRGCN